MIKQIERVMEQIIVPRYKSLDYVEVHPMGLDDSWAKIIYYFTPPLEQVDAIEIIEETSALYKMIGFKGGDIIVAFEKIEE